MNAEEKDRERAKRVADEAWAADDTLAEYDERIACEFAAVRAEERAAIVAWLLLRSEGSGNGAYYWAARDLEAGEHTAPAPKRAGET